MQSYTFILLGTLFGFLALAFLLLYPVYRFLKREEKVSEQWTREEIARRSRERPPSNGKASDGKTAPAPTAEDE